LTVSGYREGEIVHVKPLRKDGTVCEVLGGKRYRVAVGSMVLACSADDLTTPNGRPAERTSAPVNLPKVSPPPESIDLHGLTVDEAIRKLSAWLDRATLAGLSHVKVIHGLGSGRVQRAVHEQLAAMPTIRHFKINEWNPGETDVYL
jgi:DNA mismatch repair protein MutS2